MRADPGGAWANRRASITTDSSRFTFHASRFTLHAPRLLRHRLDRLEGRAVAEVAMYQRPAVLLVVGADVGGGGVVEVPEEHRAHPRPAVAGEREGAQDVVGLLLLAGERAVLVAG